MSRHRVEKSAVRGSGIGIGSGGPIVSGMRGKTVKSARPTVRPNAEIRCPSRILCLELEPLK